MKQNKSLGIDDLIARLQALIPSKATDKFLEDFKASDFEGPRRKYLVFRLVEFHFIRMAKEDVIFHEVQAIIDRINDKIESNEFNATALEIGIAELLTSIKWLRKRVVETGKRSANISSSATASAIELERFQAQTSILEELETLMGDFQDNEGKSI